MEQGRRKTESASKLGSQQKEEMKGDETRAMDTDMSQQKSYVGEESQKEQKKVENIIRIGTWNMRSTFEVGALKNIVNIMKQYKVDILAMQETKQKGKEIIDIDGYTFFNSGGVDRRLGTGFIINRRMKSSLIDFEAISERICKLRLRGKLRKLSLLNLHAPSEDKDQEIKQEFYENIELVYKDIPKYDLKIVLGDLNAKVGNEEIYRETTGGKSKHIESNENGKMVIGFAQENDMRIMSTFFDHKIIHKETWMAPDGKTRNQIDHILVERKHTRSIKDVRSYRGADGDSDHILVITKLKEEIAKKVQRTEVITRYDIGKLKENLLAQQFEEEMTKNLLNRQIHDNIDREWREVEEGMMEVAQKCLGIASKGKRKDWYDDDCREVTKKRNVARQKMLNSPREVIKSQYKAARKEAKKVCRRKKREHIDRELQRIEDHYKDKNIRNFYQESKRKKEPYIRGQMYYRNKQGEIIGDKNGKLNRWREHFSELLNDELAENEQDGIEEEQVGNVQDQVVETPTNEEIKEIINSLKDNKSAGRNGIPAEIIKQGGETLITRVCWLIKKIWEEEEMPDRWKDAVICPIYKKGDKAICTNYRGITLLDVAYKVLARVIRTKLDKYVNEEVGEYQGGFKKGRSTSDQIFVLKMIQNNSYEQQLDLKLLFIDFKQAYDSVIRRRLYQAMRALQIPRKIIKLVEMTLEKTENRVAVEGSLSEKFIVKKGLKQGDPLSTALFNLLLEQILRETGIRTQGTIYNSTNQVLAYADDIVLMSRTKAELTKTFKLFEKKAKEYGLLVNEEKTKYLETGDNLDNEQSKITITTEQNKVYCFERVKEFEYLGVIITCKSEEVREIEKRMAKGNKAVGAMHNLLRSKKISWEAKLRLYRTVIQPTVLYGCESWVMNKKEEEKLSIWERKVLRKIFGGVKVQGNEWRRRTNAEIKQLYKKPAISQIVRTTRLRWLGHVTRMPMNRWAKTIMMRGGVRKRRGRPRRKWLEACEEDLRTLGIERWRDLAMNRKKWKKIIEKF